ncbi:MAG: hypothetical protein MZU84_01060 [Sphingobacterium sp.]|nr:hypothetical protein [Sphingobacterium sp.]
MRGYQWKNTKEDNTAAILSYIYILGWIIAFLLYGKNKTEFAAYHLRQALGLAYHFSPAFVIRNSRENV